MVTWVRARWRSVLVVAVTVLVASGLVVGGVMAQTPPAKPAESPLTAFTNKLAAKLGLAPDRVSTAMQDSQKELIDEAVTAGRITKEVGDRLKQRVDQGQYVPGHVPAAKPGFQRRPGPVLPPLREMFQTVAGWLGMTPDDLLKELRAGSSLAKVAESKGKTRDQLKAFLTDQVKQRLDKAVADKKVTAEQAKQMLDRFVQNLDRLIDATHTPPPGRPSRPNRPGRPGPGGGHA